MVGPGLGKPDAGSTVSRALVGVGKSASNAPARPSMAGGKRGALTVISWTSGIIGISAGGNTRPPLLGLFRKSVTLG